MPGFAGADLSSRAGGLSFIVAKCLKPSVNGWENMRFSAGIKVVCRWRLKKVRGVIRAAAGVTRFTGN